MAMTTPGELILDDIKRARFENGRPRDNAALAAVFDARTEDLRTELREAGREPLPRHVAEFVRNAEVAAVLRAAARTATTDLPIPLYNWLVSGTCVGASIPE